MEKIISSLIVGTVLNSFSKYSNIINTTKRKWRQFSISKLLNGKQTMKFICSNICKFCINESNNRKIYISTCNIPVWL